MGRIRSIKPEFVTSYDMGHVSREARLLFILLWTVADDSGRARGDSRMLASVLYPYDGDAPARISSWLTELDGRGCILRYEVAGEPFVQVCNWLRHQKIDKPSPSKLPAPEAGSRILANPRESSTTDQGSGIRDQDQDQGSGILRPAKKPRERSSNPPTRPDEVAEQVWSDWGTHRRAKKAPVTETVLAQFRAEAAKAGITLEAALRESVARGWLGFRASWWLKDNPKQNFASTDYSAGVDADGHF